MHCLKFVLLGWDQTSEAYMKHQQKKKLTSINHCRRKDRSRKRYTTSLSHTVFSSTDARFHSHQSPVTLFSSHVYEVMANLMHFLTREGDREILETCTKAANLHYNSTVQTFWFLNSLSRSYNSFGLTTKKSRLYKLHEMLKQCDKLRAYTKIQHDWKETIAKKVNQGAKTPSEGIVSKVETREKAPESLLLLVQGHGCHKH